MRTPLVILAAFCAIQLSDGARVLGLFPHTGKSHQMVFDPLLRRLADRGHEVTAVTFFPINDPPKNYTQVSLEGLAGVGLEVFDLQFYEDKSRVLDLLGVSKIIKQINEFSPLGEFAREVCSKIVGFPPLAEVLKKEYDVVLVESFNSDCMLGLMHVYGVKAPTVGLLSSGLMPWTPDRIGANDNPSYVPVISEDFTSKMSFMQRLENSFLNIYYKIWYRYTIQLKEMEIIEKHFGIKIPDLHDLAKNMTVMLMNTYHSLNGVKPVLPGIVEVGGMHLDHSKKTIPHYIERFLNESEHGVVLFSFGSLIKTATIPKYKEDMIVNALSKLKQRVIWKFEDSGEEGTLNGNILKVKWLPQYELLQHKKVIAFVGHGGLLGMTEAISAGKPMLVVPFFGDQPNNAVAAAEAGFGKVVSYETLSEKSMYDGLQSVLSAEMRLSARRASTIWRDRQADPLDTAVYHTERAIRWGDKDPLFSVSRNLNIFQYALLDVSLVFLLAFIILILMLRIFFVAVIRFVSGSVRVSKEKIH